VRDGRATVHLGSYHGIREGHCLVSGRPLAQRLAGQRIDSRRSRRCALAWRVFRFVWCVGLVDVTGRACGDPGGELCIGQHFGVHDETCENKFEVLI